MGNASAACYAIAVSSREMIAGLLLAAVALSGADDPLVEASLAPTLEAAVREALEASGLLRAEGHEARRRALERLARAAREPLVEALPSNLRASALILPLATSDAQRASGRLPMPRRGYRAPEGLADRVRRLASGETREARAEAERARMEARPWHA